MAQLIKVEAVKTYATRDKNAIPKEETFASSDGRKRASLLRAAGRWYVRCDQKTCIRWAQEEFEHFKTRALAEAFITDYLGENIGR